MNHQNRRSYGSDHGNGGISNKNNGVSSNLSSGNNEKITSLRYPPRRQGDVEVSHLLFRQFKTQNLKTAYEFNKNTYMAAAG
ncbi:unnamed protein product [Rhizophagus irregularis]|uniref:Uncharacterized protein n=1 Tax=Rhizophagus irregularis TaxID=588596 RepID=A0A916EI17_9GLOM|nr:unnamed protein product [Rhizophagus irregularis]